MRENAPQRHRLNRVVNFAQCNLSEPLSLDDLADVACLSKFHFSRLFRTYLKETPLAFLWRLRLEQAARRLAFVPEARVTDIAYECGFASPEALSRAFRRHFGASPSQFKHENHCSLEGFGRAGIFGQSVYVPPRLDRAVEIGRRHVTIQHRPEYQVAYIRHCGPYGDVNDSISRQFEALKTWALMRGVASEEASYIGLCRSTPSLTPVRHCIYDACMVVPDHFTEDNIVSRQIIPGGKHAVWSVECPPRQLYHMWQWLLSSWLPASGYIHRQSPVYEYSPPAGPGEAGLENLRVDLCLPVSRA